MLQRGVYVVLFPFVLIALFGLIGLTLTSGNAFVDRSRLQNLLDTIAIAAATQVNMMNARNLTNAADKCSAPHVSPVGGVLGVRQAVVNVLRFNTTPLVNRPLRAAIDPDVDLIIEYATELRDAAFKTDCPATDSAQPIYVRIRLQQPIDTNDFLAGIIELWLGGEGYDLRISGSAVAGPAAAAPIWDDQRCPAPIFLCDRSNSPAPVCGGNAESSQCTFGHPKYAEGAFQNSGEFACPQALGTHFLQLVDGSAPGALEAALAGVVGACPTPPNDAGQVLLDGALTAASVLSDKRGAFNTQFYSQGAWSPAIGDYPEGLNAPGGDTVSAGIGAGPVCDNPPVLDVPNRNLANAYIEAMASATSTAGTQPLRRIVTVPILECSSPASEGSFSIKGYACVLLTRPMRNDLSPDTSQHIVGEIIDAGLVQGLCGASTVIGRPDSRPKAQGLLPPLWRIVLYKDPGARDS